MSDNSTLSSSATVTLRDIDHSGVHTQVVALDLGGEGPESLVSGGMLPTSTAAFEESLDTQATWTSVTPLNTALSSSLSGMGNCTYTFIVPNTITAGTIAFEVSPDNTNWLPIAVVPSAIAGNDDITNYTLAGINIQFQAFVGGCSYTRIRLISPIVGTGNVLVFLDPSISGSDIASAVAIVGNSGGDFAGVNLLEEVISGNNGLKVNVQTQQTLKTDQSNGLIPSDAPQLITGSANAINQVLFTVDTTGYNSISVQSGAGSTSTLTFQVSNDGISWAPCLGWYSQGTGQSSTSMQNNTFMIMPCLGRYFRIQCTAYTSGIATVTAYLRQQPVTQLATIPSTNIAQIGGTAVVSGGVAGIQAIGGNIAIGTTATANPVPTGGRVLTTLAAAQVNAATASLSFTGAQQLTIKPYGDVLNDWTYTTGATALTTTTTAAAAKAAGAAGIRNYVTGIQAQNTSATATTLLILDGATNLLVFNLPASMTVPAVMDFPTPLHGTAATALNYNFGTAAATVFLNIQGYQSA